MWSVSWDQLRALADLLFLATVAAAVLSYLAAVAAAYIYKLYKASRRRP